MRIFFSTCSTLISPSIRAKTFSSRLTTLKISSSCWRSAIFTARCEAMWSASSPGSVICGIEASASGGTFLFSFT